MSLRRATKPRLADLEPSLRRELRPGSRIVSQQFPIGRWTPTRTLRASGQDLFFWSVPES